MVVKVGRHGWSNLDRIATWRVHGRSVVAMGHTSVRGTGVGNVGGPREPWCTLIDSGAAGAPRHAMTSHVYVTKEGKVQLQKNWFDTLSYI